MQTSGTEPVATGVGEGAQAQSVAPAATDRRVLVLGAAGAIGRVLVPLLLADGWAVAGTTRQAERARWLRGLGAQALQLDVYDEPALRAGLREAAATHVVHLLTDLPQVLEPSRMAEALQRNARLREEGTRRVIDALVGTPARRLVLQSIAFAYAPGVPPLREEQPLNLQAADAASARTAQAVAAMEAACLHSGRSCLVLRMGRLYGPATWFTEAPGAGALHVDAAAQAVRLALSRGEAGIYNVAEPGGPVAVDRAVTLLGWAPDFRRTFAARQRPLDHGTADAHR